MEITDGKKKLKAMEYKPIAALPSSQKLGSKV